MIMPIAGNAIAAGQALRPTSGTPQGPAGDREVRGLRRRSKQLEQENEILRRAAAYFACDTLLK
jgi:transposase